MGLISGLAGLPLAPLRGVLAAAEQVRRQAEDQFYDPVAIRQELEDVQRRREDGELSPVQSALRECHGLQCGFCTPGFVTSITALLRDNPQPTDDEIREGLSGNFCRCTGYQGIISAVHRAAQA